LKRLTLKTYPWGTAVGFTYQGQKLTQVYDSTVLSAETHTLAYDSSYRLSSETQATRGTITRTYNADDTVATTTVQSGPNATYSYYPDGSLNTIQWSPVAGQFKYAYALPGQYQTITFPNSQTRNFSYDDQGRLTQLTNLASGGTNIATYAYGYDLNYTTGQNTMLGQRVSLTATVPSQSLNNHLTKYEYDPLYQLNKVTYPNVAPFNGEVDSWTYDPIGNRLTNTVNAVTQTYTYQKIGSNPNNWQRLINDGSNAYTYDTNGNTLTRNGPGANVTFGLNYDYRTISISGATTASYLYDYQGRRSTKTVGSATTYLYDGLNLVRETGASSADYLFGPGIDEPLAMSRGGQIYYYETDALGSVNAITNSSATVQNSYLYDAWGQVKTQTGSLANPFVYTSREAGEAGLNFYRARYYQPSIGRFLQEDPLPPAGADSTYLYADLDPALFADPFGMEALPKPKPVPPVRPIIRPGPIRLPWCNVIGAAVCMLLDPNQLGDPDTDEYLEPAKPGCPRRPRQGWTCLARCHVKNFSNVPEAPAFVEGMGYGNTRDDAERAALNVAQGNTPRGTHARHCRVRKCWQGRG
jgi:RHS repeat-associated protein